MTSPDFMPFSELTFFDRDAQDVFETALLDLQTKLPEWEPREGNTEVLLMESMALQVMESIFAINRVPNAVTEAILLLYGVERDLGQPPTATVRFRLAETFGHTIPAGTKMVLNLGPLIDPMVFATDSELTVPTGDFEGVVAVTGDRASVVANAVPAGTVLEMLDSVPFVDRVTLETSPSGGRDPETDESWYQRGVNRLGRFSETLVLPEHFTSAALEFPGVYRATTVDNYDPAAAGAPGTVPGHVTVYVYGENDTAVSAADREALRLHLDERSTGNLVVHVAEPTVTTVNIDISIRSARRYDIAEVHASVLTILQTYLHPNHWDWENTVRRNEIIGLVSQIDGVDYVASLTTPAEDIALPGIANLVRLGTATITVTPPGTAP